MRSTMLRRLGLALLLPLGLSGCLLQPGEFEATVDIKANRDFTVSYVGTAHLLDLSELEDLDKKSGDEDVDAEATETALSLVSQDADKTPDIKAEGRTKGTPDFADADKAMDAFNRYSTDAEKQELAATLMKERGFRKVTYRGDNLYDIDYQISGRLDHGFAFPVNIDIEQLQPWLVIDVRANGNVRMKAPAFGAQGMGFLGQMSNEFSKGKTPIRGRLTLLSDRPFIASNQEDGATMVGGRHQLSWRIAATTTEAPSATIGFAP